MQTMLAILLLAASTAWAQQRPSDAEIDARIQTLVEQRDVQANSAAAAIAKARVLEAEVERLKKAAKECKPEEKR